MAKGKGRLLGIKKTLNVSKKQKPVQEAAKQKSHRFKPIFTRENSILLVGEGNFSFSLSLANILMEAFNITATAYDSKELLIEKYPDSLEIVAELESLGANVIVFIQSFNISTK